MGFGNPMAMRWGRLYKGTPAEHALEPAVAAIGLPYRTQLPGYLYGFRFFPDVFIPQLGLIMEIDDKSHRRPEKMLEDADRTDALEARGWTVVRCTNEEALSDPHAAVTRMLADAGVTTDMIRAARNKPLADCLPKPGKCPKKNRREVKAAATQQRRNRNGNSRKGTAVHRGGPRAGVDRTSRARTEDQEHRGRQVGGGGGRSEGSTSQGATEAVAFEYGCRGGPHCGLCNGRPEPYPEN